MEKVRLQKYIAECGLASRRKAEEFIASGIIKVNGVVVQELGTKIDPEKDKVEFVNNQLSFKPEKKVYLMLNKPVGYVTSVKDEKGRSTVMDLLKGVEERVVPVRKIGYVYISAYYYFLMMVIL